MWVDLHNNKFALLQLIAPRHFIGDITNRHETTSTHIVTNRDIMALNDLQETACITAVDSIPLHSFLSTLTEITPHVSAFTQSEQNRWW